MRVIFLLGDVSGSGGTDRVNCDLASALAARGDECRDPKRIRGCRSVYSSLAWCCDLWTRPDRGARRSSLSCKHLSRALVQAGSQKQPRAD